MHDAAHDGEHDEGPFLVHAIRDHHANIPDHRFYSLKEVGLTTSDSIITSSNVTSGV